MKLLFYLNLGHHKHLKIKLNINIKLISSLQETETICQKSKKKDKPYLDSDSAVNMLMEWLHSTLRTNLLSI